MNKFFLVIMLGTVLFAQKAMLPESTVAIVNGIAISNDELEREVDQLIPSTYIHVKVDEEKRKSLKEKALSALIDKTLLYSYAVKKNIFVSDKEIQSAISVIRDKYSSQDMFNSALKKSNFTLDSLANSIKKDEVLKKLYKKEIEASFSDKELKKYYNENMHKFKEPEKIKVSMIYVRNNPEDPEGKSKAKKKIKEAEELLKKGENFAYVAQTYSNDPSRVMGGDMGYLHKGRLEQAVEDVAFSMDVNKTSEIIEQDIGFFIVRVEDKAVANQLPFDMVKNRLKNDLKKKEEDKRKAELLDRLKQNSVIVK